MNENIVTMSLDDYTKLIVENHDLKNLVSGIRRKVENEVEEKIMNGRINALNTREEVLKKMELLDTSLLCEFTTGYSYTWERISRDSYDIVSVEEVKALVASKIKYFLNERLKEIIEEEKDKENERNN